MEDHRDHLFELSCRSDFALIDGLIGRLVARRRKRLANGIGRVAADLEGRGLLSISAMTTLQAQLEIQIVEASDSRFSVALRRALLAGVAVFAWLFGPLYQGSANAFVDHNYQLCYLRQTEHLELNDAAVKRHERFRQRMEKSSQHAVIALELLRRTSLPSYF